MTQCVDGLSDINCDLTKLWPPENCDPNFFLNPKKIGAPKNVDPQKFSGHYVCLAFWKFAWHALCSDQFNRAENSPLSLYHLLLITLSIIYLWSPCTWPGMHFAQSNSDPRIIFSACKFFWLPTSFYLFWEKSIQATLFCLHYQISAHALRSDQ